jgi:ABC-type Na+ transport system ATPase subunit NatA
MVIDVKDRILVYSDGTKAVDDISFDVQKGEFFRFLMFQNLHFLK